MMFSNYVLAIALVANVGFAEQANLAVVVIGAGLAGLTTAYRLMQKGRDVHLYEAKARVGGRVLTAKIGDHIAELGAQNLADGGKAENIRRLIDEMRCELEETDVRFIHDYYDGKTFSSGSALHKNRFDLKTIQSKVADAVQKSHNMREVLNELLEEKDSLYKSLAVRLAAYEGAPVEKLSSFYAETLYHMLLGGLSSAHQSTGGEEKYIHLASVKGGNAVLLEKLAQALEGRLHLNRPLAAVSRGSGSSYELVFQNGQKVKADILVLAMPCSAYEDIEFERDLIPEERLQAIRNVQYGTNAKVLVPLSQPALERRTLINDRAVAFLDIGCNVLTLYYIGETGRFSEKTIAKTYNQEKRMLEMGFRDLCPSSLPEMAQDKQWVCYEGPIAYSWPNDPNIKGSYSYVAPGQEALLTAVRDEQGEMVKELFAPIDSTLYFAGEHASILMDVSGTMEAACESGERVARMITR